MAWVLVGLEAVLSDPGCNRVVLRDKTGKPALCFSRRRECAWTWEEAKGRLIKGDALPEAIREHFGEDHSVCECYCGKDKVIYALENGSVRVRRQELSPDDRAQTRDPFRDEGRRKLMEVLGIAKSKRKAKMKQAGRLCSVVESALPAGGSATLRVLDIASGRSYLGFTLIHSLAERGYQVHLRGLEADPALVEKCREIAAKLGYENCTFEVTDVAEYSARKGHYEVLVSLHACDTLTDDAIRIACEARIPFVFLVPCCQHEFRDQLDDYSLSWMSRYGLVEERLADVLTDGFRCLVLDSMGYEVKVLHFVTSDITPKNLLIQAVLRSAPRPALVREALSFLWEFNIHPKLARIFGRIGIQGERL
jgi:hypothetical protein